MRRNAASNNTAPSSSNSSNNNNNNNTSENGDVVKISPAAQQAQQGLLSSFLKKSSSTNQNNSNTNTNDTTSVTSTSSHNNNNGITSIFEKNPPPSSSTPPTTKSEAVAVTKKSGSSSSRATAKVSNTTTTTTRTTTNSGAPPPAKTVNKLDPFEWHSKLVSNESKRKEIMNVRTTSQQVQYTAMEQLLQSATKETSYLYRTSASLIQIQDEFAKSLTLLQEDTATLNNDFTGSYGSNNNEYYQSFSNGANPYDIDDPEKLYNQMVESVTLQDTLPEKVKTTTAAALNENGNHQDEEDEATENSLAGSDYLNDETGKNAIHEVAVVASAPAVPTKRSAGLFGANPAAAVSPTNHNKAVVTIDPSNLSKMTLNGGTATKHQPPVFAISFPNPACSFDAYFILYKQHEVLQQTFSRNGINQVSIEKVLQMKELVEESTTKLVELAGTIVQEWKLREEEIQKLWNTYLTIATEVLSNIPKTTSMSEWPKSSDVVDTTTTTTATTTTGKGSNGKKYTTADVWMAEIVYRTAVKYQEMNYTVEEQTISSLYEILKNSEIQRRMKITEYVHEDILSKHATIYARTQLSHKEALETYLQLPASEAIIKAKKENPNTLENDEFDNDHKDGHGGSTKKAAGSSNSNNNVSERPPKLSVKEQIQNIAQFIGTTTVWDDTTKMAVVSTTKVNSESPQKSIQKTTTAVVDVAKIGGVDIDMYVDSFDQENDIDDNDYEEDYFNDEDVDEDGLPLLKNAIISKASVTGSSTSRKSNSKRKKSKRRSKKEVEKSTEIADQATTTLGEDSISTSMNPDILKYKVNNVVVLDQESYKHAYFMDQLLYSSSLLESHYVQYASVVGLPEDNNYSNNTYSYDGISTKQKHNNDDFSTDSTKKCGLLIVTSDDILHLFEIPVVPSISTDNSYAATSTSNNHNAVVPTIIPGCNPEDALMFLLQQSAHSDLIMKEQQDIQKLLREKSLPAPSSPSKLSSFFQTKSTTPTKDELNHNEKCFHFNNIVPSLSMLLSECTIRQSLNKEQCSVRISHNAHNPRIGSNKLIFATTDDQQAFLKATKTEVTMWDLK